MRDSFQFGEYVRKQRRNKYVKIDQRPDCLALNVNKPLVALNSDLPLLERVALNVNQWLLM